MDDDKENIREKTLATRKLKLGKIITASEDPGNANEKLVKLELNIYFLIHTLMRMT